MNGHEIALWSAVAAFFSSLLAIGVIEVFNPDEIVRFATSLLVALVTGGTVYAKQRTDDAKEKKSSPAD